ncbi:hypothetical protein Tco_0899942 [Tanacetum coccineum]
MYYSRFTKAIIQHFISKDKSISIRNRLFMHTVQDDSVLGFLRFVSKIEEYQVYKALIPAGMTNKKMLNSISYKTYLTYATGASTPKKARKFKKPASLSKKNDLADDEGLRISQRCRSTLYVLLRGLSKGAGLELEVPDEQKGKSTDTSEGTGLIPWVPNVSKADSFESEYESWGDSDDDDQQGDDERTEFDNDKDADLNQTDEEEEDEFVHTPDNYVPTDDKNIDNEEYDRINKEMYSDVNVELKDTELEGDQVKDVDHATVTAAPATQKTEAPLQSSSISSDYATKFLNFDNIPSAETEIISMMDIKVQHEDPSSQTSPLPTVPVTSEVPTIIKDCLGTSLDDTLHKVIQRHTTKLIKEHSVPADVIEVPQQQHKPQKSVVEIRKIKMEQAGKQQETKHTITSSDTAELQEFDQKRTLFETMTKTKSFNKNTKQKALYHALMESILEDEDAMDKGVTDRLKKRKPDDADKDEGPPAGLDQRLKRKKTGKYTKPSKKAKSTGTSKGTTESQPKYTGKSAQAEETVFEAGDTQVPQDLIEYIGNTDEPPVIKADPKDWFKKPKRPPTPDPEWNKCKTVDSKPTQKWLSDLAKAEKYSKTIDDLISTLIDFSAFFMNRLQISDITQDILVRPAYKLLKGTCRSYIELE